MKMRAWRSAKWPGTSIHPSDPKRYGPPKSSKSASAQSAPWSAPSVRPAATMIATAIAVLAARPFTEWRRLGVVPACEREQRELHEAHDPVGAGEEQRRVVERLRHAEGDDEQRGHRDEDRDPDDPFLRIDHARQPRVADPRPPEQAEHEEAPGEPLPGRVGRHQRRALGEREHEDEIEEQLERQDALLLAQHGGEATGAGGCFGGHGAILATASRVRAAPRQAKPQRAADYDRSDVLRRTGSGRAVRDRSRLLRGAMSELALEPASDFSPAELAGIFTAGYEGYYVPLSVDEAAFRFMAEVSDLDLGRSRVAVGEDGPVGICVLGVRGDEGWIGGLGVARSARRSGIGELLMRDVLDEARAAGLARVTLEVLVQNEPAIRLYEKLGFEHGRELEVWSLVGRAPATSATLPPRMRTHGFASAASCPSPGSAPTGRSRVCSSATRRRRGSPSRMALRSSG